MAYALAYGSEIANNLELPNNGHLVRVFAVPSVIGECGGVLDSCPDWRLLITVSTGDLYDDPLLFELPMAKGWRFVSWDTSSESKKAVFQVETQIPGSNLNQEARKAWRPTNYRVSIWLYDIVTGGPRASAEVITDEG